MRIPSKSDQGGRYYKIKLYIQAQLKHSIFISRNNRKWMYDKIEIEGNDFVIKNEYKHKQLPQGENINTVKLHTSIIGQ